MWLLASALRPLLEDSRSSDLKVGLETLSNTILLPEELLCVLAVDVSSLSQCALMSCFSKGNITHPRDRSEYDTTLPVIDTV